MTTVTLQLQYGLKVIEPRSAIMVVSGPIAPLARVERASRVGVIRRVGFGGGLNR